MAVRWLRSLRSWIRLFRRGKVTLNRPLVAQAYLSGQGLELGALHRPLRVPPQAKVTFVDRLTRGGLFEHYPDLAGKELVPVDLVDDAERLGRVADASQDFVIANHLLEHCQDPIGALKNFLRVLRPGGVLYLTVPDHRYTFDRDRPVTALDHLWADHRDGPQRSLREHYEEWVRLVEKVSDPVAAQRRTEELLRQAFSIHFHVWTQSELLDLLLALKKQVTFEIEVFLKRKYEVIAVLRK